MAISSQQFKEIMRLFDAGDFESRKEAVSMLYEGYSRHYLIVIKRDFMRNNYDKAYNIDDKDGDLDLFVVTGSNEFAENAPELHDLLYLNDGKGNLKRDVRFPMIYENGSSVSAADYDKDGDIDLFVGTRMINAKYGQSAQSNLFINDGTGGFKNQSKRYMTQVTDLGMVTDSEWSDVNGDGYLDLITHGHLNKYKGEIYKSTKSDIREFYLDVYYGNKD